MTNDEIVRLTKEVFVESFEIPPERMQPQAHIFTDFGLDSLDIVDLVVALQQKFGVKIRDDERVRGIRTLQDICEFIAAIQNEGGGAG